MAGMNDVRGGAPIEVGESGQTGTATGPVLFFQVFVDGAAINPLLVLPVASCQTLRLPLNMVHNGKAPLAGPYDEAKFVELVLFAAELLTEGEGRSGAIKLNKLLYFAEFAHIRTTGRSITGVELSKAAPRTRPPAPALGASAPDRQRAGPARSGQHRFRLSARCAHPARRTRSVSVRPVRVGHDPGRRRRDQHAVFGRVSELSHHEPGWCLADEGETIPAATALLDPEAELPERDAAHRGCSSSGAGPPPRGTVLLVEVSDELYAKAITDWDVDGRVTYEQFCAGHSQPPCSNVSAESNGSDRCGPVHRCSTSTFHRPDPFPPSCSTPSN